MCIEVIVSFLSIFQEGYIFIFIFIYEEISCKLEEVAVAENGS